MTDLRIVVVDDHPVFRAGLRGILEGSPGFTVVGEAADGSAALEVVAATEPDVVLLDLRMPVLDGAATIERLAVSAPAVRVLVLTTYDQDQDILRAVEAGATGVLLKDAPREELFRAVRAVARGESVLAPGLTARLLDRWRAAKVCAPTDRELEVLQLVARGLTNRAIGRQLSISEAAVKTNLVHALDKLGVDDRTAAVTVALERGLLALDR
ncbi:response regulator transcription factor [soil metagenome]